MKPYRFEYPKPSIVYVVFFHKKERDNSRGTIKVYKIGVNYKKMKAVIIDGLTHVGMVPEKIPYCKNMNELIGIMKEEGWSLVKN